MTSSHATSGQHPRRLARSIGAVLCGLVTVVVLSLGTDQVLHVLDVYPPWSQSMHDPWLSLLALTYRILYAVIGSFVAARLAPHAPMRHAMAVGVIGLVLSAAGAVVTITRYDLGPDWYPIALVITPLPCAWVGGVLSQRARVRQVSARG